MKKLLVPYLVFALCGLAVCPAPGLAQKVYTANPTLDTTPSLDSATILDGDIHVPNGSRIVVSISSAGESIRTVLHNLAEQGKFNLVMDDSVDGNVTVELKRVSLNQALQSVASLGNLLLLPQKGNIYLAISRQAAQDKGLSRQLSKMIPVRYSNANRLATILNQSLFSNGNSNSSSSTGASSSGSSGSTAVMKVKADSRTNSLVVVGTAREIELAQATVTKLDLPRERKTFYLSHANALDVATMLASSIFNDGTGSVTMGQSASGGGGANGAAAPSTLRVERQDIQEGSGVNVFGSDSSGSSTAGLSSAVTLRGFAKTTDSLQVSPEGALIIPDTRQNAITIMGTAEQIALAESLIPTLDAQLPQVAIEASLIEITDDSIKNIAPQWGVNDGQLASGFNNQPTGGVTGNSAAGLVGMRTVDPTDPTGAAGSGIVFSTNPLARQQDYLFQLKTLVSKRKAKVLANPTIVATHDTEAIISIVDEILRRVTTTVSEGFATQTIEIGEAGIVMDILPKIGEDGTINMRIRPCVSSPLNPIRDNNGNIVVTLVSKRDLMAQNVRIRDGQTLVIGGLVQQTENLTTQKFPGLGDLPIVSAMFRASAKTGSRSELVLLLTPHIINKGKVTPVNAISGDDSMPTGLAGGQ
jgi:type II secretory pathway component GspD/PulD (secretin)